MMAGSVLTIKFLTCHPMFVLAGRLMPDG